MKIVKETQSPEQDQADEEIKAFLRWEAHRFWWALGFGAIIGSMMILLVAALAWSIAP